MERMSREEFAAFYRQTAPALRRYLARVAANANLADDLLQEAYIRLIHAAPSCEPQRRAYLYRTATNLLLDHCRAVQRERTGLRFRKWSQPVASEPHNPVTAVERVFALLNVRERALLWLAYVEEAAHAEIVWPFGWPKARPAWHAEGPVCWRFSRSWRALKRGRAQSIKRWCGWR
jgi:RNA polymerase sigma-70 factor, ECF subfamily